MTIRLHPLPQPRAPRAKRHPLRRAAAAVLTAAAVLFATSACGDKYTQPFQDAPRTSTVDNSAATVITMPDGFTNLSTKCFEGDRIFVGYHGDSPYAALAVVGSDPNCKR